MSSKPPESVPAVANLQSEAAATVQPDKFLQIDEDGYFKMGDLRVADLDIGREMMSELTIDSAGRIRTQSGTTPVFVEAFDEPFVALDVIKQPGLIWRLRMPYGFEQSFSLESLTLDEWDRFHGRTLNGVPFVFSRSTQARFFNLLDGFEDDAIFADNKWIPTVAWLANCSKVDDAEWWTKRYEENQTQWDLNAPSHVLDTLVPKLKLHRLRVLVLGCGAGHDAAWFARRGHIVTAIDFSSEGILRARKLYGDIPNLSFKQADAFQLPPAFNGSFDLIFEHTLYCAINPSRREELMSVWRRLLVDHGHVMGVFFTFDRPSGPPYGSSEWEIRARIDRKSFKPLYWTRLRDSPPSRLGFELFVYAQKSPKFTAVN